MSARLAGLVRRHPLIAFLLVFNTFGQALAFAPQILRDRFGVGVSTEIVLSGVTFAFILAPALIAVRISRGPEGLRALLRDAVRFDVRLRWWLVPLLLMPLLDLGLAFTAPPGGWRLGTTATAYATSFLPGLVWNLLSTNWWEEAAWTGFFQATLQERLGPLRAVLITTPFFTLEHLALVFDDQQLGGGWPRLAVLFVVIFFWRAMTAYLYNRTRSLALVGTTHAGSNAVGYFFAEKLGVQAAGGMSLLIPGLVVLVLTRGRLGLPRVTEQDQGTRRYAPSEADVVMDA